MAKDGTIRGGKRVGSGKKKDSLTKKVREGHAKIEFPAFDETGDEPQIKKFLQAEQFRGKEFCAAEVYREIWAWLKERGCEKLVDEQLMEQYAVSAARWRQCEDMISNLGLTGTHPTTGGQIGSVYVKMSQDYMKQMNMARYQIYQVVKENSVVDSPLGTSGGNDMEILLRTHR